MVGVDTRTLQESAADVMKTDINSSANRPFWDAILLKSQGVIYRLLDQIRLVAVCGVAQGNTAADLQLTAINASAVQGGYALRVQASNPTLTASPPTNVSVDMASEALIAANTARRGFIVVNLSANDVFLGLNGATAEANKGIPLCGKGATFSCKDGDFLTTGAVNAIASGVASVVAVQEFS